MQIRVGITTARIITGSCAKATALMTLNPLPNPYSQVDRKRRTKVTEQRTSQILRMKILQCTTYLNNGRVGQPEQKPHQGNNSRKMKERMDNVNHGKVVRPHKKKPWLELESKPYRINNRPYTKFTIGLKIKRNPQTPPQGIKETENKTKYEPLQRRQ